MKRGFTILFIELFCVQASLFLGALLQEYALFCQIMLLFFLALTYRRIYLLARRSLKNAQEEAKFQTIKKQEQLQKEQEQLFVSRKQETLEFQQSTIRKLETLQNYLKMNEYDKIQDYLPAITDDFPSHLPGQPDQRHPCGQKISCHAEKYQSYLRGSSSGEIQYSLFGTEQYIFQPAG